MLEVFAGKWRQAGRQSVMLGVNQDIKGQICWKKRPQRGAIPAELGQLNQPESAGP